MQVDEIDIKVEAEADSELDQARTPEQRVEEAKFIFFIVSSFFIVGPIFGFAYLYFIPWSELNLVEWIVAAIGGLFFVAVSATLFPFILLYVHGRQTLLAMFLPLTVGVLMGAVVFYLFDFRDGLIVMVSGSLSTALLERVVGYFVASR